MAFDKATGALVWQHSPSARPLASPMTYWHNGTQYLVMAAGLGPSAELVAYALPIGAATPQRAGDQHGAHLLVDATFVRCSARCHRREPVRPAGHVRDAVRGGAHVEPAAHGRDRAMHAGLFEIRPQRRLGILRALDEVLSRTAVT
jgi:hypothetical protein